ncbi:hypothetical protein FBEOM_916 [Fusarium beomiforme]|uniref:Uncharacterized protein n=1 Tax=Fusarium beomiforme TaxID=44412 RepID=A0A9P5E1A9_9HYPO|nr:hypothetical protein FBEOM_916 [Fusarium beomiforme]
MENPGRDNEAVGRVFHKSLEFQAPEPLYREDLIALGGRRDREFLFGHWPSVQSVYERKLEAEMGVTYQIEAWGSSDSENLELGEDNQVQEPATNPDSDQLHLDPSQYVQ